MTLSVRARDATLFFATLTILACSSSFIGIKGSPSQQSATTDNAAESLSKQLEGILQTQATAWNNGDIPSFMSAYWNDPRLTFSAGGETQRGWTATRDRYLKRYPDRTAMGKLQFTNLETEQLSEDVALMLGQWHLEKDQPAQGNFSLVWKKIDGKWLIVHDHSSSKQP